MKEPEPMDRAEVEARLARHGLTLSKAQIDEIHAISGHVARAAEIVGSARPKAAEPALILPKQSR